MADPDRITAPYGTWPSPLAAEDLAASSISFSELLVDGDRVLWCQSDPARDGRLTVMQVVGNGRPQQISLGDFSARTRVHEYGGGALGAGYGVVLASSWEDQRVYLLDGDAIQPVTPEPQSPAGIRWAGMQVLPSGTAFVAVRETHGPDRPRLNRNVHGAPEAVNEIVHVDIGSGQQTVLVSGPDFVSGPWVSPGGTRMAWLQWDHPDMPWDTAELWVGELDGEAVSSAEPVAGGHSAVCDVHWVDEDHLLFCDDPDGWWNVHSHSPEGITRLQDEQVESGIPRWMNDFRRLTSLADGTVVVGTTVDGFTHARQILPDGQGQPITIEGVGAILSLVGRGTQLVAIAGGPALSTAVWQVDPSTGSRRAISDVPSSDSATLVGAVPAPITFDTAGGATAHALAYAPTSATHRGPDGERPPLIVLSHGGPTGAARTALSAGAQYWVSRGFAVVDVNYRGSVGYGRAYRDALRGNWGIHDVADCIAAAEHLVAQGQADPERLIIEGGSAGGYTTLLALCTTDSFAAGGSLFGVSDLRALATDTHKFESRYLDSMIGSWPDEEATYVARSPITHVNDLSTPMIVLQGDEDAVVPPSQAEEIVAALRRRGIPHAYLLFAGEQHGFRKTANVIRSVEARLAFYGIVLGFTPADTIDLPEFTPGG